MLVRVQSGILTNRERLLVHGNVYTHNSSKRWQIEIQDLPDSAWPEEAWIKQREVENRHEKEYSEFLETIKHLSGKEKLAAILAYPIRKMLNYKSVSRELFQVNEITEP